MKKWSRRSAFLVLSVVALWVTLGPFMFYNWHVPIDHSPKDYGMTFESVTFEPSDQPIRLSAWWLPATHAKAAIVMVHGVGDNKSHPIMGWLGLAHDLVSRGYSILDLDLRNHGESGDSKAGVTMGEEEANDVVAAIDFLKHRDPSMRIGAIGYSLGGETVLYAAAKDSRIEAVAEDSAFADDIRSILPRFVHAETGLPGWLFEGPFLWSAEYLHRLAINRGHAVTIIGSIRPRRVLLMHNDGDRLIPSDHCRCLAAMDPDAEVWISPAPSADSVYWKDAIGMHARAYQLYPKEYVDRVTAFFDETFDDRPNISQTKRLQSQ